MRFPPASVRRPPTSKAALLRRALPYLLITFFVFSYLLFFHYFVFSPSPNNPHPTKVNPTSTPKEATTEEQSQQDEEPLKVPPKQPDDAEEEEEEAVLPGLSLLNQEDIDFLMEHIDYSDVDSFGLAPQHVIEDWEEKRSCMDYSKGRNLTAEPVLILHYQSNSGENVERWTECDCPCGFTASRRYNFRADATICVIPGSDSTNEKKCGSQYKILYSMESAANYPLLSLDTYKLNGYDILATYDLESDVPAAYFSWEEYDFFRPLKKKTATAEMIVMISNCAAGNRRLDYIREMEKHGLTMHSYGRCLHNKDVPKENGQFLATKIDLQGVYRFSNAFENSNTKDYVTEKLFGTFVAGSVPLHMGVEVGVHKFGPSEKSIISVHDFDDPQQLVTYLKYLTSNETAYNEYLNWKTKGVSREWRALLDISRVHSWCRLCIKIGDMNRWKYSWDETFSPVNPHYKANIELRAAATQNSLFLQVRERGKYWFKALYLPSPSLTTLRALIKLHFPYRYHDIFQIYRLRKTSDEPLFIINTDNDLASLSQATEIEVIILDRKSGSPAEKWDKKRRDILNREIQRKQNRLTQ